MIGKKWENLIRRIPGIQRYYFNWLNQQLGLALDYQLNQDAVLIFEAIFLHREYAAWFPFYEKATIIDIGAHYGYFALFAAMNLDLNSQILSFEPSPENFAILSQNIDSNRFPQIQSHQLAIASHTGKADLYGGKSFNHSLIGEGKAISSVPTLSLEDLFVKYDLAHVDFLKLDCEGGEYEILLNCPASVLQLCTIISMEFHDLRTKGFAPQHLIEYLEQAGFQVVHYQFDTDYSGQNQNFGKLIMRKT